MVVQMLVWHGGPSSCVGKTHMREYFAARDFSPPTASLSEQEGHSDAGNGVSSEAYELCAILCTPHERACLSPMICVPPDQPPENTRRPPGYSMRELHRLDTMPSVLSQGVE
jgi:hypothetical protein